MSVAVRRSVWKKAQQGHLEVWEGYARRGDRDAPERRENWSSILRDVDKHAPVRPGETVLDIGCGLDTVLDFVDAGVRGFTLDTLMAKLRPLGLSARAAHTAGGFEALPFRSASFDRVLLMNLLDHVQDARAGMREVARVLRPGGVLVLSVDTYAGRRYQAKRLHKWWGRVRGARTKHPLVFSHGSVERLLRRSGFELRGSQQVAVIKARRTLFVARRA